LLGARAAARRSEGAAVSAGRARRALVGHRLRRHSCVGHVCAQLPRPRRVVPRRASRPLVVGGARRRSGDRALRRLALRLLPGHCVHVGLLASRATALRLPDALPPPRRRPPTPPPAPGPPRAARPLPPSPSPLLP